MKIRLLVYMNEAAWTSRTQVFERIVEWDSSLAFPFDSLFKIMKCLFGSDCIVTLEMF